MDTTADEVLAEAERLAEQPKKKLVEPEPLLPEEEEEEATDARRTLHWI
jgi:hypothetical protein